MQAEWALFCQVALLLFSRQAWGPWRSQGRPLTPLQSWCQCVGGRRDWKTSFSIQLSLSEEPESKDPVEPNQDPVGHRRGCLYSL